MPQTLKIKIPEQFTTNTINSPLTSAQPSPGTVPNSQPPFYPAPPSAQFSFHVPSPLSQSHPPPPRPVAVSQQPQYPFPQQQPQHLQKVPARQTHLPPAVAPAAQSAPQPKANTGSSSPVKPPVSPIDPEDVLAQLSKVAAADKSKQAAKQAAEPTFIPRPAPVPISESENSDAIALRSAIALLQLQREKSKKDIQTLEKARQDALRDPKGFVEETQKRVRTKGKGEKADGDILKPTLSTDLPTPQNVFRMPPINWAKYHIAGDTLDKMHNEELARPSLGHPEGMSRNPPYVLAAPYRPSKSPGP